MTASNDFGLVHDITLKPPGPDGLMILVIRPRRGDPVSFPASSGALRKLWAFLAKALFPAGEDLTKRIGTVMLAKNATVPNMIHDVAAYARTDHPDIIMIGGFTTQAMWTLAIKKEDAENLWAELENHLHEV
jgi:hypothetical protein